jgi:hypothetical protein
MALISPLPPSSISVDAWSYGYLVDKIFNDLMDCQVSENGLRINKYILQARDKFKYIRIKSPVVKYYIYKIDIKEDTKRYIGFYQQDWKSKDKAYRKLDGLISEVIAQIYKEAEPLILSTIEYEDPVWVKRSINEVRTSVSKNWEFV